MIKTLNCIQKLGILLIIFMVSTLAFAKKYSCVDRTHQSKVEQIFISQKKSSAYWVEIIRRDRPNIKLTKVQKVNIRRPFLKFEGQNFEAKFKRPGTTTAQRAHIKWRPVRPLGGTWVCKKLP